MNTTTKTELAEISTADITTLPPAARAAVVLKSEQTRKDLVALAAQSAGIVTVLNADGREQAHRVGMTLKTARVAIEKTGKAAREDATAFGKAVIAEEKALIGLIEPEETRVLKLRDAWDEKIEAEKAAKIAAERARVEAIQARIGNITAIPGDVVGMQSSYMSDEFAALSDLEIDDTFAEFREAAAAAKADALSKLDLMFNKAKELEAAALAAEQARKAEAERLAAERAELARQREEQAERERLAKIESDRIAVEQAAEGKRIADLLAAQEAELRRQRETDAARIRAEQAAQEKQQMAMSEISGIQQQVMIAQVGRAPYVKGGDAASYAKVLAETKAWPIREENFGTLVGMAQLVKDTTIAALAQGLASCVESDHAEALEVNAQFDIDREADRVRLQELIEEARADVDALPASLDELMATTFPLDDLPLAEPLAMPESITARDALIDAGITPEVSDKEIVEAAIEAIVGLGLTSDEAAKRLEKIYGTAARERYEVAA